ncbi:hypothetical protein QZH41_001415 [Actinostola sp. cb2023]|nr:hypothetical protein QZH41_001415 [Actinostola sp. cb2023]
MACRDLATHTGIHVARIDFSDPQGGKGAADRLVATCKSHIRTYINEGHDVCTAADMKDALLSNGGLKGVRVAAIDTILEIPETSCTIKGITKLNNFEFSATDAITCWRAYGVGQDTTIQTDKLTSDEEDEDEGTMDEEEIQDMAKEEMELEKSPFEIENINSEINKTNTAGDKAQAEDSAVFVVDDDYSHPDEDEDEDDDLSAPAFDASPKSLLKRYQTEIVDTGSPRQLFRVCRLDVIADLRKDIMGAYKNPLVRLKATF